jgi:hypothetical protein
MVEPIKIQISLKDLLDVINAHRNPEIAGAILDGSYVNPITHMDEQPRFHESYSIKNDDGTQDHYELIFISYNKWSNEVTFKKSHPNARSWNNTMSLEEWRSTIDFNPYPADWGKPIPGDV